MNISSLCESDTWRSDVESRECSNITCRVVCK